MIGTQASNEGIGGGLLKFSFEKLNKFPGRWKALIITMLHMFNNNTFTDFRTAYTHALFPSLVIQVILIEPIFQKTKY